MGLGVTDSGTVSERILKKPSKSLVNMRFKSFQVYKIPSERLYVTYFGGDDKAGLQPDLVSGLGKKYIVGYS